MMCTGKPCVRACGDINAGCMLESLNDRFGVLWLAMYIFVRNYIEYSCRDPGVVWVSGLGREWV